MGFISYYEIKQRLISDGMRVVIMPEFGMGNRFRPRCGIIAAENSEISFYFLIYSFSFSIRLWVVGSGKG